MILYPKTRFAALLFVALHSFLFQVSAAVRLPSIFSDHMVVQAEKSVPVWGWADPGEEVTVTIGRQTKKTTAGHDGKWKVTLNKLKSGETATLTIQGKNKITIQDVLIGEVWLCSGQSNMAMTVERSNNFESEKSAAKFPSIRMFTVARVSQIEPQADCKGTWVVCSPETVGAFSATAYFFGRDLHLKLRVPVGLINSSVGGTPIESWTSLEAQSKLPEYKTISESWTAVTTQPWDEVKAMAGYKKQMATWKDDVKKAKAAGKKAPTEPKKPESPRLNKNYPGNLFNGMIAPVLPYAIRGAIWYQGEANAWKSFASLYGLQLETLIKDWRTRWGYDFPFAWAQLPDFVAAERAEGWVTIREEMLKTLRAPKTGMAITLGLGDSKDIHPKNKQGVGQRLAMWALADVYKQKGIASSGPLPTGHKIKGDQIIVTFKHTDGELRWGSFSQPVDFQDHRVTGFLIAGADQKWVPAQAIIRGKQVIISSSNVKNPVAVRYAWMDNPIFHLYNGAGLPATPFRTDDWK